MNVSFNLIDEAWIPCITVADELVEVSLRDMLARAPDLREISCETAIQSAAILPLALALLHRVFGPADHDAWKAIWDAGAFDLERLDAYLTQWHEQFDLFHPQRPFYQVADERVEPKSLIHLVHPMGNTGTLFTHANDDAGVELSAAEAARQLLAARHFRTAGLGPSMNRRRVSFKDSPYARGVIFWLRASTLFETLMLNLMAYSGDHPIPNTGRDAPSWEMDEPFAPRTAPLGYLDYLTWSNNRILLIPDVAADCLTLREAVVVPALNIDQHIQSPQKRYVQKEQKGEVTYSFLYFNANKALWRDYDSLLKRDGGKVIPPAVIQWVNELTEYGKLEEDFPVQLMATGMLADQAKVIFYRQEIMPFPLELLRNPDHSRDIGTALKQAEDVAIKLRNALNILAEHVLKRGAEGKPDNNDRNKLVKQWNARERYWIDLEPLFWRFVEALIVDSDEAMHDWAEALQKIALASLHHATKLAGDSPWALKGGIAADRYLRRQTRQLLNDEE